MFWKKKKPAIDTLIYEPEKQRHSFRYKFKKDKGFWIFFNERSIEVLDISAGGISFANQGFKELDHGSIKFTLDIPDFKFDTTVTAGLRILRIDKDDICHAIFEHCSLEHHELIHKYVLEMQKNDIAH